MLEKIISGGQTGVDRAALDAALQLGFPCGGWIPYGRRTEEGALSPLYPLVETPSAKYEPRTEWNVRDSDGTLIFTQGAPSGGTALTIDYAEKHHKPYLVVDFNETIPAREVKNWITNNQIATLNVAGPRASKQPTIYDLAKDFVEAVLID